MNNADNDATVSSSTSSSSTGSNPCWTVMDHRCSGVAVANMDVRALPSIPSCIENGINGTSNRYSVSSDERKKSVERRPRLSSVLDPPKDYIRMMSRTGSAVSAPGQKMEWGPIWIAAIILFLLSMQFSVYLASLWPYLTQIDPSADQTFYGFILAAYSAAQMVASPILGHWYSRVKRARPVVTAGVIFSIAGNLVYMFTEAFSDNRKWVIMVARFLTGLGGATGGTIRAYIAMASTTEQRGRAIAIGTAAISLGATAGPVVQTCVTPIGHPGLVLGPFHISQYTAASYLSVASSLIMLVLLYTRFKENYIGIDDGKKKGPYHVIPRYDKLAALLCIAGWFTVFFCRTNSDSVESPYTMAVFSWTNNEAVYYNSIIMACSSILSFLVYILMAVYGARINERAAVIAGLCMLCAFYGFTFPWPFFTGKMNFKTTPIVAATTVTPNLASSLTNSTVAPHAPAGCDPEMEWCNYTPRLPLPVYLAAYPLLSAGLPVCNVAISTLFSKILGPRQQGFMQSLMVMSGACARLLGPILITWLFSIFGPRIAWTMTTTVVTLCISVTVMYYNRLVPLNMKPKLKSGQKLHYDGGLLHHF